MVTKALVTELMTSDGSRTCCICERSGAIFKEFSRVLFASGDFGSILPTTRCSSCTVQSCCYCPQKAELCQVSHRHKTIDLEQVQVHLTWRRSKTIKIFAAETLRELGGFVSDLHGNRFLNEMGRRKHVAREMWKDQLHSVLARPVPSRIVHVPTRNGVHCAGDAVKKKMRRWREERLPSRGRRSPAGKPRQRDGKGETMDAASTEAEWRWDETKLETAEITKRK